MISFKPKGMPVIVVKDLFFKIASSALFASARALSGVNFIYAFNLGSSCSVLDIKACVYSTGDSVPE